MLSVQGRGEEQEAGALRAGMIAQGRASETSAPLSWYTYHRVTVYTAGLRCDAVCGACCQLA